MPAADSAAGLMTAEELEQLSIPGKTTELVRGRLLVREPPSALHGRMAARMVYVLSAFVRPRELGDVQDGSGFKIESGPDTVRAPDMAFVSLARGMELRPRGYPAFAPDLAVEIVSPNDRSGELLARAGAWLEAGTHLVWVIDPLRGEAQVYRSDASVALVPREASLDGEGVLPGFHCPLADVIA
jgi:Uma2 family endonuclease